MTNTYRILGIDPGSSSGAITTLDVVDVELRFNNSCNMPDMTSTGILSFLNKANTLYDTLYVSIEDVGGSRPGNSAKSARTFAEHVGMLKMALIATNLTPTFVLPRKWMYDLFGKDYPSGSENLKARKQYIHDQMKRQFPDAQFTLRQADSVAIAYWLFKQKEVGKV